MELRERAAVERIFSGHDTAAASPASRGREDPPALRGDSMTAHDPEALLAETRAFNAELERLQASMPAVHTVSPEQTRQARREGRGIFPPPVFLAKARTLEIEGPGGAIPLRIIEPEQRPAGAFLHIHEIGRAHV